MRWFRLYSDILDDPKMEQMDDKCFRIFIQLLSVACETEDGGRIKLNSKQIGWRIRRPEKTVLRALDVLIDLQIISKEIDGLIITNWDKRQFKSDDINQRVKRYRNVTRNGSVTLPETETETDTDTDTEKEENLTSSEFSEDPPSRNGCPHSEILKLYHKILPILPAVKDWTPSRQTLLRARWSERKERQSLEWWKQFFEAVEKSDFLCGRAKAWKASLEWLIRPKNFPKVLEGQYSNNKKERWCDGIDQCEADENGAGRDLS